MTTVGKKRSAYAIKTTYNREVTHSSIYSIYSRSETPEKPQSALVLLFSCSVAPSQ